MKVEELHIGDTVVFMINGNKESIPMTVVGILSDGTVYLDFDGNEGDVWEEEAKDLKRYKEEAK